MKSIHKRYTRTEGTLIKQKRDIGNWRYYKARKETLQR